MENVGSEGTKRLGYLSDNSPVDLPFRGSDTARKLRVSIIENPITFRVCNVLTDEVGGVGMSFESISVGNKFLKKEGKILRSKVSKSYHKYLTGFTALCSCPQYISEDKFLLSRQRERIAKPIGQEPYFGQSTHPKTLT